MFFMQIKLDYVYISAFYLEVKTTEMLKFFLLLI